MMAHGLRWVFARFSESGDGRISEFMGFNCVNSEFKGYLLL